MDKKLSLVLAFVLLLSVAPVMAQDFCDGNFDCDVDVDGTDAFVFKSDFGRSQINNPCPTGSDCCSGTLSPLGRWCDQGNGTVKDMTTGLVWLKNAGWGGLKPWADCDAYDDAHTRAGILYAGMSGTGLSDGSVEGDWRLPTKSELVGIMVGDEYIRYNQMYFFTDVKNTYYWSSTTNANVFFGWVVYFGNGYVGTDFKTFPYYVWPVRGPIKCGNNTLDAGEECDGDLFPLAKDTCEEAGYPYGGVLTCNNNCKINTQDCYECFTCSDCGNQACIGGHCGPCVVNEDCCAPLVVCFVGICI